MWRDIATSDCPLTSIKSQTVWRPIRFRSTRRTEFFKRISRMQTSIERILARFCRSPGASRIDQDSVAALANTGRRDDSEDNSRHRAEQSQRGRKPQHQFRTVGHSCECAARCRRSAGGVEADDVGILSDPRARLCSAPCEQARRTVGERSAFRAHAASCIALGRWMHLARVLANGWTFRLKPSAY